MTSSRSRQLFGLLLLFVFLPAGARSLNADGVLLLSFKHAVTADPLSALADWSHADDTPCAWNGVICMGFPLSPSFSAAAVNLSVASDEVLRGVNASLAAATVSRVISLVLPGAQLSGSLPADLGRVEHLRHLDLSGNNLNGTMPATLFNASELRILSLADNDFSGEMPDVPTAGMLSLQVLNLSDNALSGRLPAGWPKVLPSLTVLSLANNYFSGELPAGEMDFLEVVDVSANLFNGSLPPHFGGSRLRFLNVSSNRLSGPIPSDMASRIPANVTVDLSNNNLTGAIPRAGPFPAQSPEAFAGNPELCGPPLQQMCSIPSTLSNPPNASGSPPAFAAIPKNTGSAQGQPTSPGKQERLRPAAIAAIAAGDLAGAGILLMVFLYVYHVKKKKRQRRQQQQEQQHQKESMGPGLRKLELGSKQEKPSSSMSCCVRAKNDSSESSEGSAWSSETEAEEDEQPKKRGVTAGGSQGHGKKQQAAAAPTTLVTVDGENELEMETLLKASAYILGATGSSIVYKAVLADGTALAVRRIGESGGADKLKDFEAQVRAVARFRHPNVLRLRGFYWGADEKLLIHDYAPNGSLANIAFNKRLGASSPLHMSLEARLRVARGVARGLAYLHEKKCVHGNVKPSNILLSADLEPWIGDFGLDRLLSGEGYYYRTGTSARLFGSKRSMHSTSSLPDLSQMPGAGASPCGSSSASAAAALPPYQAPEHLKNLRPNAKWDAYSFGMVLLELISGRVYSEVELCQWQSGFVVEEKSRVLRMADPALRGEAEGKEDILLSCFKLGFACCAMAPQKRPSMREAMQVLERIPSGCSAS